MLKNWRFPASGKPGKVSEVATPPDIRNPVSQACTQAQMQDPIYRYWCRHIGEGPVNHRKQWEFVYILQALARGRHRDGSAAGNQQGGNDQHLLFRHLRLS